MIKKEITIQYNLLKSLSRDCDEIILPHIKKALQEIEHFYRKNRYKIDSESMLEYSDDINDALEIKDKYEAHAYNNITVTDQLSNNQIYF